MTQSKQEPEKSDTQVLSEGSTCSNISVPFATTALTQNVSQCHSAARNRNTSLIRNPGYPFYFEFQRAGRCGMHALNNALGHLQHAVFDEEEMKRSCAIVIQESTIPDDNGIISDLKDESDHMSETGWYSDDVMSMAIRRTLRFELLLGQQLEKNPHILQDDSIAGAISNQNQTHWVALKKVGNSIWLLDSVSEQGPRVLSESEYHAFIRKYKHSYPIKAL